MSDEISFILKLPTIPEDAPNREILLNTHQAIIRQWRELCTQVQEALAGAGGGTTYTFTDSHSIDFTDDGLGGVTAVVFAGTVGPKVISVSYAASIDIDFGGYECAEVRVGTLTGDVSIGNMTGGVSGGRYVVRMTQDGTGGRIITDGTGGDIQYSDDYPSLVASTDASKSDDFGFIYDGTKYRFVAMTRGFS